MPMPSWKISVPLPPLPPRGKQRRPRCTQREEERTSFTDLRKLDSTKEKKNGEFRILFRLCFFLGSLRRTQTYRTGKEKSFVLSLFLSWTQMRAWDKHPASFSSRKEGGGNGLFKEKKSFFERNWRLFPFSFFCTAVTDAFKLPHTKGEKQDSCYTYWPQWGCPNNKYEKRNAASSFSCHHHAKSAFISRLQRRTQKTSFFAFFFWEIHSL